MKKAIVLEMIGMSYLYWINIVNRIVEGSVICNTKL